MLLMHVAQYLALNALGNIKVALFTRTDKVWDINK